MLCQPNGNFVALKPNQAALLSIIKCLWGLNKTKVQPKDSIHPSIYQQRFPAPPGGPQGAPKPVRICNPSSESWAYPMDFAQLDMPSPLRRDIPEGPFDTTLWRNLILAPCVRAPFHFVSLPKLMTRGDDQCIHGPVNWGHYFAAQLFLHHNSPVQFLKGHRRCPCPCPCPSPAWGLVRMCCEWFKKKEMLSQKKLIYVHSSNFISEFCYFYSTNIKSWRVFLCFWGFFLVCCLLVSFEIIPCIF